MDADEVARSTKSIARPSYAIELRKRIGNPTFLLSFLGFLVYIPIELDLMSKQSIQHHDDNKRKLTLYCQRIHHKETSSHNLQIQQSEKHQANKQLPSVFLFRFLIF